jgi:Uroporphyrinogen decarboxylase (URO-D)
VKITKRIHEKDTMTSEERLQAVINLQVPDRVPVSHRIYYFAAKYAGVDNADLYDAATWNRAIDKCFRDLGPWDFYAPWNFYHVEVLSLIFPMKVLEPGIGLPRDAIHQYLEEEIMPFEDYQWILKMARQIPDLSFLRLVMRWLPKIWDHVQPGVKGYAYMMPRLLDHLITWRRDFMRWSKEGVIPLAGAGVEAAFDSFSMARGLLNFSRDLKKHPDLIAGAADAMTPGNLYLITSAARILGVKRAAIALHRSSNDFISPDTFRRLSLPSLKDLVERLKADGRPSVLHCDGNWDLNFEALRELPAGCAVVELDGASDIFKAKEIIGDRMCIAGDVPADLLALGSTTEVDEYCHRLIEEVGKGGGFILSSGCEVAPNAKPENVKTMMESVVKYGYYGGDTAATGAPATVP